MTRRKKCNFKLCEQIWLQLFSFSCFNFFYSDLRVYRCFIERELLVNHGSVKAAANRSKVAQMAERVVTNPEATGSSPRPGSNEIALQYMSPP